MTGLILLIISGLLLAFEGFKVFQWLEKHNYVYWDEKHSIEHLAYLTAYTVTLVMWVANWYGVIPQSYFYFALWVSGMFLHHHIRKERIDNT